MGDDRTWIEEVGEEQFAARATIARRGRLWGYLVGVGLVLVLGFACYGRLWGPTPPYRGPLRAGAWSGVGPDVTFYVAAGAPSPMSEAPSSVVSGDIADVLPAALPNELRAFVLYVPAPEGCTAVAGPGYLLGLADGRARFEFARTAVTGGAFSIATFVEVAGRFDSATTVSGTWTWKECLTATGATIHPAATGVWRASFDFSVDVYG